MLFAPTSSTPMHLGVAEVAAVDPADVTFDVTSPLPPRGEILKCAVADGAARHGYYLYLPRSAPTATRLFVTVHGISRNAREHVRRFAPFAEAAGVIIVAPRFPAAHYPDYQRLGRDGRGARADHALLAILAQVAARCGADVEHLYLFGYSGGAQFVHRFVMAYPGRVARYAVAAAGWYTLPDAAQRYPHGIKRARTRGDLRFDAEHFLAVPALALVGERDTEQNGKLRESARVVAQQGPSRVARARNWVDAMRAAAAARGLATRFEFALLPDSRHLFSQCMKRGAMGARVFEFLFDTAP